MDKKLTEIQQNNLRKIIYLTNKYKVKNRVELAEVLKITDKAISQWINNGLPRKILAEFPELNIDRNEKFFDKNSMTNNNNESTTVVNQNEWLKAKTALEFVENKGLLDDFKKFLCDKLFNNVEKN